jgi:catechol 2,3-dioxygenase-like lactoylglutathione lyase family enzyme
MAILSGIPVLNCQSIEATQDFYRRILHFVVVNKRESNGKVHWLHLMHGGVTIMLQRIEPQSEKLLSLESPQQSSISLYFFSNNIKELHHFVSVNYKNVSDLVLTDYQMQEFSLLDPEGNTVIVGQSVNKQN